MTISCLSSSKTFSSVRSRLPSKSSFPCTSRSHELSFPDSIDRSAFCVKSSSAPRFSARATSQKEALESRSSVVSDENVPEGHRGLHGFLYGDNGADVHASELRQFTIKQGEDDGSSILPVDDYVISRDGLKYAGVYAVYDSRSALQFIGYSRSIVLSLRSHLNHLGKEKCSFVRVKAYTDPAMITRNRLEQEKEKWLNEAETLPPGNSSEKDLWDSNTGGAVATFMTEAEKLEYEEKKLKLRKAMGENLHDDVEGEEDDAKTRRLKLLQAMEGDDWSSVISGQTNDALNQSSTVNNSEQSSSIVSPFEMKESKGSEGRKGLYSADTYELTVENVDKVLNEVRPYLIADGGNVEVVSVDSGVISLRLQGACGTCPSSTVTMKMGIERVLKEKFGEAFKEVVQVDQQPIGASVMAVDAHLEMLRPAIHSYSGFVEVVSVADGECRVKYKGPPPIGMGIQAAIKDKFPDITTVVLLDA